MAKVSLSVKCNCRHGFQDGLYGKGVRVATASAKGHADCTVCGVSHREFSGEHDNRKGKKSGGSGGAKTYFARPPVTGWVGGEPIANGWKPTA